MSTINLIQGLSLLESYRTNKGDHNTEAEYDVIYAYATDIKLTQKAKQQMLAWGWCREDDGVEKMMV